MKKRENSLLSLTSLYLCLISSKITLIIFIIGFILSGLFLVFIANPMMDNMVYLASFNDIHTKYFNQSIFIIELFNSILLIAIIITLSINSNSFDSLFISYVKRNKIILSKLLALITIILVIIIFDSLILFSIPLILYQNYSLSIESLKLILFLFISLLFEGSLEIMLTTLIQSIFVPIILSFLAIVLRVMSTNYTNLNKILSKYWPIIKIENIVTLDSLYFILIWSLLLLILYFCIYSIKDLK